MTPYEEVMFFMLFSGFIVKGITKALAITGSQNSSNWETWETINAISTVYMICSIIMFVLMFTAHV